MFKDEQRCSVWQQIRQQDLSVFATLLTPQVFSAAAAECGLKLGASALNLATLAWLGIAAAMRPTVSFAQVLLATFRLLRDMDRLPHPAPPRCPRRRRRGKTSKHDPRRQALTPPSEEAFAQARALLPLKWWVALLLVLGRIFQSRHDSLLRFQGFRLLCLDGTCLSLERRKTLGRHFGYAHNKHGTPRPQARMVMLLLANVRLPWRYELSDRAQGEPTLAARLLRDLQEQDLVLMDRLFFNCGLFQQIQQAKAFFAIRRPKAPRLKTLRRLGTDDRLVSWRPAAHRWKGACLTLRVIDYQINGFRRSAIVTNVLDTKRLSRQQLLGLEGSQAWVTQHDQGLYHRRWQIETAFRELKCVQQMQGNLRGRTPETIQYEVAGHVLLYLLTRWLMVEAAVEHGQNPLALSFTHALRRIVQTVGILPLCTRQRQRKLVRRLLKEIATTKVPPRPGRHYPRPNDGKTRYTGRGHRIRSSKIRK